MANKIKITHDQMMAIAMAGFSKSEWAYNTRDLFETVSSIAPDTHRLYMNGQNIMSIYIPSEEYVTFTTLSQQFNHMAAINKLKEVINQ